MANVNRVVVSGNLTRDPELRQLPGGSSVCKLRIAVNTRKKDRDTNQWNDVPNYFDVTVWGAQGENVAKYLQKGSPLLIDGRLEWREWQAQDGSEPPGGGDHRREHAVHRRSRRRRRRWTGSERRRRVRAGSRSRSAVGSGRRRRRHSVLGRT